MRNKFLSVFILFVALGCIVYGVNNYKFENNKLKKYIACLEYENNQYHKYYDITKEYESLTIKLIKSMTEIDSNLGIGGLDVEKSYDPIEAFRDIVAHRYVNSEDYAQTILKFFDDRKDFYQNVPVGFPIDYQYYKKITSGFDWRVSPITNEVHFHHGIDIAGNKRHAPIKATANGIVFGLWKNHPDFGKIVYLQHYGGFESRYAHLSKIVVNYGQYVKKGQIIGYMGNSGKSTGEHLHYEVRKDGIPIDPIELLKTIN